MAAVLEGALAGSHSNLRRTPHVLLTPDEVEAAVDDLIREDLIAIDIETTKARPRSNRLLWVGLGAAGRSYLIPCGHPLGAVARGEHKEKTPACLYYPPGDERRLTKLGKPSMRMIEHTVEATYHPAPKQLKPDELCGLLQPLLWSDVGKIGHNVKFDLMSLAKYFGNVIPPGPYHDTVILRHVIEENLDAYDLKSLVCSWFGIPWEERAKFYPNLGSKGVENYGLDVIARYLAKDVRYAWLMFHAWYPMLKRAGVKAVYDFEMSLYPVLMEMEYAGFPVDTSAMGRVKEELALRQTAVQEEVWKATGDQFSLNHTESKRWVMFGEGDVIKGTDMDPTSKTYGHSTGRPLKTQNLRVRSRTKEQQRPAVTQEVLEFYSERGNRMAELFLEWSLLEKLRGTFIEGLSSHLLPSAFGLPTIHTSFKQHGTVTGRLSAAEPNLQQLPRGTLIRDLFVAGDGYVLIVADYDQVELRVAGYASGDQEMVRVFQEGQDIHALAASVMLEIPLDQVTKEQRHVGKTQNFGTLYGASAERIAAVAGVSKKRAERFITNYFNTFAGLEAWKRKELKLARNRGDLTSPRSRPPYVLIPPNGRRRRLPDLFHMDNDWRRWRAERQAINAYVQGFASNITKLAMIDLHPALEPLGARMIAQVHDEIVVRAPIETAAEALVMVQNTMGGVVDPLEGGPILGQIPLIASAAQGRTWAEAKG